MTVPQMCVAYGIELSEEEIVTLSRMFSRPFEELLSDETATRTAIEELVRRGIKEENALLLFFLCYYASENIEIKYVHEIAAGIQ